MQNQQKKTIFISLNENKKNTKSSPKTKIFAISDWQHEQHPYPPQPPYSSYQYDDGYGPPPKLPPKSFKKKYIKAPLAAIKNALLKSKKQLRRQNSMNEHDSGPRVASNLRRQHSMIERTSSSSARWRSPEFHYQQQEQPYYNERHQRPYDDQYYDERSGYMNHSQFYDDYGNKQPNFYEQENLYANRALIEFERKAAENVNRVPYSTNTGTRIVRRHSMADRTGARGSARYSAKRPDQMPPDLNRIEREEIYQTRSGAFMLQQTNLPPQQQRVPMKSSHSHVDDDEEALYQSRREMHLDHLYQSKREMQQRIHQGRMEVERTAHSESPSSSSTPTTPQHSDYLSSPSRDLIYQSRRELKERGFKTRTQLRDRIYQSRQETLESIAEPAYTKRVEVQRHQEPIIDESKEVDHVNTTCDTNDRTQFGSNASNDRSHQDQHEESLDAVQKHSQIQCVTNTLQSAPIIGNQNSCNSSCLDDDDPTNSLNQSSFQKTIVATSAPGNEIETENDTTALEQKPLQKISSEAIDASSVPKPQTPRTDRTHISNVMKRVGPPAKEPNQSSLDGSSSAPTMQHESIAASRTSIETQYTSSQISLPTGPPVAQSTPYASEDALPSDTIYPPIREQTTTSGIFDENGGMLCDEIWKVSINIPKGAIPPGIKQEIYFTVTDPRMSQSVGGPPLDMENGWCKH